MSFRDLGFASTMAALICIGAVLSAQTPTSPTFEVASIKPNNSGMRGVLVYPPQAGLLHTVNFSLAALIQSAYDVAVDQVVGGPDWVRTLRFDVMAKTPNDQPAVWQGPNSVRPMLQALLQERFKLTVHHETRPLPKYALVLARSDGRLGPQLRRSTTDCSTFKPPQSLEAVIAMPPGSPCSGFRPSGGSLVADSVEISALASFLAGPAAGSPGLVDRDVVDRTGLTGRFSFTLTFDPVSIFTTLQEQLGLKLEPATVASDIIVIDHVEPLIEN